MNCQAETRVPRVSVGVPVYNGEDYLASSLTSILNQSYQDLEVVISDNASEDGTQEICEAFAAKDPRVRYFRNEKNLGAAPNYNRVFEESRGEYFKWASHDDVCEPDFIRACVEALDQKPEAVLAFSQFDYIDAEDEIIRPASYLDSVTGAMESERVRKLISLQIKSNDIFWAIFGLIRSAALKQTALIEPYLASDQSLLFHLTLHGEFLKVPETLFKRREHADESMAKNKTGKERAVWFDTSKKVAPIYFPNWRLIREHMALVHRQSLSLNVAGRCYYQVLRRFATRWRILGGELKAALRPSAYR